MLTFNFPAAFRRMTVIAALAGLALAGAVTASSARQVGTAVVNGRVVILDSDGTWKCQDQAGGSGGSARSSCETLEHIKLRLDASGWVNATLPGDFIGSYSTAGKYFIGIVYERSGSNDGYTYEFLQQAIVQNAAAAAGTGPENIPVLDSNTEAAELNGFRSVTYILTIKGAPFVFHNIFKIYPDRAVQFAFWSIGREYTDDFREQVEKFTQGVSFSE
jgi:hypothetical protein